MDSLVRWTAVVGIWLALAVPGGVAAQARNGKLIVTVIDQTGGVLAGADVTVVGLEDATKRTAVAPVKANDKGIATVESLLPGRYTLSAEFPGFEKAILKELRVRAGDNRQTLVLPISRMADSATVELDRQEAAAERATTFGTVLTREQIDALSEDPDELRRQLQDMAGPDAVISVDSFEGQQLPHKSQIRSIRISRDQFAAEIHQAGFPRIEVVTNPGGGPFRGGVSFNFYDSALDGVNPLVARKGPAQNKQYSTYLSGTLVPEKLGYFLSLYGNSSYSTPIEYLNTAEGRVTRLSSVRSPNRSNQFFGGFEYALTKDQLLRVQAGRYGFKNENIGIGAYNEVSRAYTTDVDNFMFYAQEMGPLGRRFATNTRLSMNWSDETTRSAAELPTIVVTEATTMGGAQQRGGTRTLSMSFGSDLDYVRGIHSFRTGVQIDGSSYRSDQTSNYLGTYTFENLDAYLAGRPRSYTRRIGDPEVSYRSLQAGVYIQDDIRLRKNLTLSPGIRYEAQAHLGDYLNLGPRFGVTWAPFASGRTTLRASAGIFYDWLSMNTYRQTLQVDGFRQQEINIIDPAYPDPGTGAGVTPPMNRYVLADTLTMGRSDRFSTGVSQSFGRPLTVNFTYAYIRAEHLLVGANLNAPIDGVRPDPVFANVIQAVDLGRSRQHTLTTNFNVNLAPPGPPPVPGTGKLFVGRRQLTLNGTWTHAYLRNNTDGAFSTPATNDLSQEWGPGLGDVRNRLNLSILTGAIRNFTARFGVSMSSAPPLTARTGTDDNGDLVFNDRPDGYGRNSLRTTGTFNADAGFSYAFALGTKRVQSGGGISVSGSSSGGYTVTQIASQEVPRYRLNVNVSINNITNHANYSGYGAVVTSPGFLKPNAAFGTRRISFNTNLSF
ncbi:MAG: carboxypeptidase regulatory-like domain-containing protein [Acidobacteria bacterium]|nr:carboxypeptidase regulatory-like domain-containing protein [Acidobacteriota bacterium]